MAHHRFGATLSYRMKLRIEGREREVAGGKVKAGKLVQSQPGLHETLASN